MTKKRTEEQTYFNIYFPNKEKMAKVLKDNDIDFKMSEQGFHVSVYVSIFDEATVRDLINKNDFLRGLGENFQYDGLNGWVNYK